MDFDLLKLEGTLAALERLSVLEEIPLSERSWAEDPCPDRHRPEEFLRRCEGLAFRPFQAQDRWGGADESRVFRLDLALPDSFAGGAAFLRLTTGREGGYTAFNPQVLVYVDGQLIQGLDVNHRLLPLASRARPGQEVRVLLHAYAGTEPGLMELGTSLIRVHP